MQVVGRTNEREIWVASQERPFRLNELLVMEGHVRETAVGEVEKVFPESFGASMDEGSPT